MPRLTEAYVKNLTVEKRTIVADDVVTGFALRTDPSGRKTYIFRYRIGGQQTTYTIGSTDAFTAAQARDEARKIAGEVARGNNPNDRKKAVRAMPLFKEHASRYLETTEKISLKDDESKIRRVLIPRWGSRPLDGIRNSDVRQLLTTLTKAGRSPATVNRYRSLISTLFNRAISDGIPIKNPVDGIDPLPELNERTRWLKDDELARFLDALESEPENSRNCILMMLLTGIRRGNVMRMKWSEIERIGDRWIWTIPRTKAGKSQVVQLGADAASVLEMQRKRAEVDNPYVFPGRRVGTSLTTVQQAWNRVIKKAEISDIRLHDLRHTFASHAVSNGVPLFTVSKLLGHSSVAMSQRYSHLQDKSLHEAAETTVGSILRRRNG